MATSVLVPVVVGVTPTASTHTGAVPLTTTITARSALRASQTTRLAFVTQTRLPFAFRPGGKPIAKFETVIRLGARLLAPSYDKGSIGNPVYGDVVGVDLIDLAQATQRAEDPPIVIGVDALGGVWLSFDSDREGILTVSVDDSAHPVEIEAWVGPNYAVGMRNLRLVEWSGGILQPLTAVARFAGAQVQPEQLSGPTGLAAAPLRFALQVRPAHLGGLS